MLDLSVNEIVVIGAGQAAIQLAHSLRAKGYEGALHLIGAEAYPPYQRPPLSKAFLKGEMEEARLYLKPASFYETKNVSLHLGTEVTGIDRDGQTVATKDGQTLPYDRLVIATGTRPRQLPELEGLDRVQVMRGIDDAKTLKDKIPDLRHVTVLGGGYIGLEAAAVLRKMGIEVTVIERMPRLLARVTGDEISAYFKSLHESHGVEILFDAEVEEFEHAGSALTGIRMQDGRVIGTDLLLVGIGVLPNQELAEAAGLEVSNGIHVDADARTNDPNIYAIGDCSFRPLEGREAPLRLESVPNAIEQAEIAACHITGKPRPGYEPPWFWSDQYDTKIQTAGLFTPHTHTVIRGDVAGGKFAVFYFAGDDFVAVDAVNDPQSFMAGKQILKAGLPLKATDLQDQTVSMMDILKSLKNQ
ncbi:NAD(P)/FAD-dependent oxidoreductase [Kordiimonas marina]|uniref:NAD(P)/FAD-dependent oxidoreductase n=1 Tax=Kordiimonas marina TaxID=2872312 RepID=UPI001FF4C3F9|nr:FAD-dependent oxidoreductase [Kordiimonas marina]MCJ9427968.1 FAD-dependent oxidoreductase [Kordiimonas marina]